MNINYMDYETMNELIYKLDHIAMAKYMKRYGFRIGNEPIYQDSVLPFIHYIHQIAQYYDYFDLIDDEHDYAFLLVFKTSNPELILHLQQHFLKEDVFIEEKKYIEEESSEVYDTLSISFDGNLMYHSILNTFLEALACYTLSNQQKEGTNT